MTFHMKKTQKKILAQKYFFIAQKYTLCKDTTAFSYSAKELVI